MKHLSEEQCFSLVDGGVAPNQESVFREHLAGCAECRGMVEDIRQLTTDLLPQSSGDDEAHVQSVMRAIERRSSPVRASKPEREKGRAWIAAAAGLALAASVIAFVGFRSPLSNEGEFAARGSERSPNLARNVGVRFLAGGSQPGPLRSGTIVTSTTTFTATYTNIHPKPVHALVFAVDSANVVHWLYPAYTREGEDPAAVVLEPSTSERVMPTSVLLDSPAEGSLRLYTIATEVSHHVSDIEKRRASDLELGALNRDFHGAVTELVIEVRRDSR